MKRRNNKSQAAPSALGGKEARDTTEALAHLQIVLDGMTDQHAPLGHVRDVLLHFLEGGRCQGNPKQNKKTARKKKRNKNKKPALKEENW